MFGQVFRKSVTIDYKILNKIQQSLQKFIVTKSMLSELDFLGGADVSYKEEYAKVCVCILDFKDLQLKEKVILTTKTFFPYKAGYLMFREAPIILKAIGRLKKLPHCFIFDANGILHPRHMGMATFLGMILKIPTIGVAKNYLLGDYKKPKSGRGSYSYIKYRGKVVGIALRTKDNVREIYVSCGWGITLNQAKDIILRCSRYRIPEPLRIAHSYSKFSPYD